MEINISLRDRFGREAEICFRDRGIDLECPVGVREKLQGDLQDVLKVFGGLIISMMEDRLADTPDQHGIMEEFMSLVENYGLTKIRQHGETPN